MKQKFIITSLVLAVVFILSVSFSVTAKDETKKQGEKSASKMFAYKPPMRGAPGSRMGGGTRGEGEESFFLSVLVPSHTGFTTKYSPTLYWYLSKPVSKRIEFTLNDEELGETLIRTEISADRGGIQRLDLSDYKLGLSPKKEYSWFVTIIIDSEQPSKNIFSGGGIQYVEPSKALGEKLAGKTGTDIPLIYAQEGIWYDALAELSQLIEGNPKDKTLYAQRNSLINEIGLHEVAEFE